jgi:hypothetical protein
MGDTPSDGSGRLVARAGPPGATRARTRSAIRRTTVSRRAVIIGYGMLLATALTVVVVFAAESPIWGHASKPPQAAAALPDNDLRTAKITRSSDGAECWQTIFDNQTGRMTRSRQPCETTTYDGNGAPVPVGTIHRLDAISKSFSGH